MHTDPSRTPHNVDGLATRNPEAKPREMAEAYYLDLTVALGDVPREGFDALLEYLDEDSSNELWHACMVGYGLALTTDAHGRRVVEDLAAAFLMLEERSDA